MSWLQKLHETYQACKANSDLLNDAGNPLLPVSHISVQAHIEVTIDDQGEFRRAEVLSDKPQTIIPASEASASRTSGPAAHPLADKIQYCAGDYVAPEKENKKEKKNKKGLEKEKTKYELYEEELRGWCESPYSHPKARAVYAYISKKRLLADLLTAGVLWADEDGNLLDKAPKDNPIPILKILKDQSSALVRWRVESPGDPAAETWKDAGLQQAWKKYDASRMTERTLCMLTGEKDELITTMHPRNIRRPGDNAKLISGNDTSGFTFRGRFDLSAEACSIGYEASHQAHNALRWLIRRQAWRNGDQVVLAWAVPGKAVPNPMDDLMAELFFGEVNLAEEREAAVPPPSTGQEQTLDHTRDLGLEFAQRFNRAMRGYDVSLDKNDDIVVLGLDSATTGRIAITFYRNMLWDDYRRKLERWQEEFAWMLRQTREVEKDGKKKKIIFWAERAPTPDEICFAVYGSGASDQLKKATIERLLPCIVDAKEVPKDLLDRAFDRACRRDALEQWEWDKTLRIVCALHRGRSIRLQPQQRSYKMVLDPDRTSRDYLYGRLLAVADYAEQSALRMADENRPTNAERLMQRFAARPNLTWLDIEKQLAPYMNRLKSSQKGFYVYDRCKRLKQAIFDMFDPTEFNNDSPLSPEFLLGYNCQMSDFYKKKEDATDNNKGE